MRLRPTTRVLHAWIALLAILFGALAPAAAAVLAEQGAPRYMEICTAHGVERIELGDDGAQMPAPPHCDYCVAHCHLLAPPPPAGLMIARIAGRDFHPPLFYRAPRPLHAWMAASPRGPPGFVSR